MPAPTKPNTQQPTDTPGTAPGNAEPVDEVVDDVTDDEPAGAATTAGAENGAGTQRPKSKKPDGITPEVQRYLDAELAKARRSAETEGERRGREALQAELEDRNATDTERLNKANAKVTQLQTDLTNVKNDHARLLMALKVGLPKPEVNFKRLIITEDEEALEADALELKESLGVSPNGNQQPVHTPRGPRGGNSNVQPTRSEDEEETITKVGAQASDPMYRAL